MPSTLNPPKKTNVIYLVLDDMGFSDLGCFGSEVQTPNVDALAADGLLYNNFTVCPASSPTRASLLTGRDNNAIGMGSIANMVFGPDRPETQGRLHTERHCGPDFEEERICHVCRWKMACCASLYGNACRAF